MERAALIGRVIGGRIELQALIGRGGMGAVYRAHHRGLNKRVAVKVLDGQLPVGPDALARFEREAKAAARIDHPGCVQVLDFGADGADRLFFMVMEHVDGESLAERLAREQVLAIGDACRVVIEVLDVLETAHAAGVIHRDLKPSNVLLSATGPKVCDFGIAKLTAAAEPLTATRAAIGTPAYMSPEQALGREVDARTDVYACGVILFELIAGCLPFQATTPHALLVERIEREPLRLDEVASGVPAALAAAVAVALEREPKQRIASAGAFRSQIAAVLEDIGPEDQSRRAVRLERATVAVPPAPKPAAAPRHSRASRTEVPRLPGGKQRGARLLLLGAAAALALVLAAAAARLHTPPRPRDARGEKICADYAACAGAATGRFAMRVLAAADGTLSSAVTPEPPPGARRCMERALAGFDLRGADALLADIALDHRGAGACEAELRSLERVRFAWRLGNNGLADPARAEVLGALQQGSTAKCAAPSLLAGGEPRIAFAISPDGQPLDVEGDPCLAQIVLRAFGPGVRAEPARYSAWIEAKRAPLTDP